MNGQASAKFYVEYNTGNTVEVIAREMDEPALRQQAP
jgi:hypothetical protein